MILKTAQTGELWLDANSHAQPGRMGPGQDPRVPGEQPGAGVRGREPAGTVRLDASHAGGAGVFPPKEEGAGLDPRLLAQGEPAELGPCDALDPAVPARRGDPDPVQNTPTLCHHLHPRRCGTSGRNRPAASASEWTGDALPVRTRLEAVWRFQ